MLNIEILGGVGEYGRNCFYIENHGKAILLDCGVMKNSQKTPPDLTPEHVEKLGAVFISHSHIDHVGALPLLEKMGYTGPVLMSHRTAQQLLQPIPHIRTFHPDSRGTWIRVNACLAFQWGYSGHLIGSVWYKIQFFDKMLFFSGDYVSDSYLLKATLPEEDGTIYDVAFIDSGHVEKCIDNREVLQKLLNYVNIHPDSPFVFPSSFSGKTVDIVTYLAQQTSRAICVDAELQSLFKQYEEEPENIWPHRLVLQVGHKQCSDSNHALYFVREQDEVRLEELAKEYPTAIFIPTGYSRQSFKQDVWNQPAKEFFYKTHPDYQDIISLSQSIHSRQTIYFHSPHTNLETTFQKEEVNNG
ncbi:MBL fold metallo-hydrolase [Lysinibacillus sp. ZYM-1]|uniref:MBL fold metallo-hydrolase n=1 Tax=Lysinibacillus sp. ZYM-1 TaxID=1681184 RepID=UPI0006CEA860|nr:MBL fold metallo-hydrolase [Lysinibacillus sp. ZYM-1]KPN95245.1 Zn-dependent hydrolase [Lysinibacillus sp. ZYM-1]